MAFCCRTTKRIGCSTPASLLSTLTAKFVLSCDKSELPCDRFILKANHLSLSYVRVGIDESVFQRVVQCFVVDLTETGLDHFDAVVFTPVVDGREARHGIRFGPNFCIRPVYRFGPFVLSITTNWIHKCINFCFNCIFFLPLVRGSSFSLAKTPRLPGWIDTKTDTINRHERQLCRVINGRHGRVQLESWMLIIDWHGYPRWEKRRTTILSALSDNGLIFFGEWFYQTFDIHLDNNTQVQMHHPTDIVGFERAQRSWSTLLFRPSCTGVQLLPKLQTFRSITVARRTRFLFLNNAQRTKCNNLHRGSA